MPLVENTKLKGIHIDSVIDRQRIDYPILYSQK